MSSTSALLNLSASACAGGSARDGRGRRQPRRREPPRGEGREGGVRVRGGGGGASEIAGRRRARRAAVIAARLSAEEPGMAPRLHRQSPRQRAEPAGRTTRRGPKRASDEPSDASAATPETPPAAPDAPERTRATDRDGRDPPRGNRARLVAPRRAPKRAREWENQTLCPNERHFRQQCRPPRAAPNPNAREGL